MAEINAPETRLGKRTDEAAKKRGLAAKAWLKERIEGKWVVIESSMEKGSFGRWLARVWIDDVDVNQQMLDEGWAVPYEK